MCKDLEAREALADEIEERVRRRLIERVDGLVCPYGVDREPFAQAWTLCQREVIAMLEERLL